MEAHYGDVVAHYGDVVAHYGDVVAHWYSAPDFQHLLQ